MCETVAFAFFMPAASAVSCRISFSLSSSFRLFQQRLGANADLVENHLANIIRELAEVLLAEPLEGDGLRLENHQRVAVEDRQGETAGGTDGGLGEEHGAILVDAREWDGGADLAMTGSHLDVCPQLIHAGELAR